MFLRTSLLRILNFILILPVAVSVTGFQPVQAMTTRVENPAPLSQFDLITASSGWVLLEHHLFWTEDGGQTWVDVSPPILAETSIESVHFLDDSSGWMLLSTMDPDGLPLLQLARTPDRGTSWTIKDLPLLTETIPDVEKVEMGWFDSQTGWISVKQSTGSNFSIGALFTTRDGGVTWSQSWLPVADRVYFSDPLDGWVVGGPTGDQIFRSQDAGGTWQSVSVMDSPIDENVMLYPPLVSGEAGLLVMTRQGTNTGLNVYQLEASSNTWLPAGQVGLDVEPGLIGLSILDPQNFVATIPGTNSIVHMVSSQLDMIQNTDGLSSITELDMVSMDTGWGKSVELKLCHHIDSGRSGCLREVLIRHPPAAHNGWRSDLAGGCSSVHTFAVCFFWCLERTGSHSIRLVLWLGQHEDPDRAGV